MAERRNITLTDVAAHAGVSPTTVSYVLNGLSEQMRIGTDTQERVRQAAADLGYRPNRSARSLRTSKSAAIAVISDFVASGHFASEMLAGASTEARAHGHVLLIGETEGDPDVEKLLVEEFLERQVDGFIYATLVHRHCRVPAQLTDKPLVLLNCIDPEHRLASVVPDERAGGRIAAQHMLTVGGRSGLYVVGQDPNAAALAGPQRLHGIQAELAANNVSLNGLIPCDWNVADAFDAVNHALTDGVRPRGLICMNDRVAFGAYQALAAHDLRVGVDVHVVSFDGTELAFWMRPRLTSVALPFPDLGAAAVRLLMRPEGPGPDVHALPMTVVGAEYA